MKKKIYKMNNFWIVLEKKIKRAKYILQIKIGEVCYVFIKQVSKPGSNPIKEIWS